MASKTDETKDVSVPQETPTPKKAKTSPEVPTYTVKEFASAPNVLGVENSDLIIAAFKVAGKESATLEEAKDIVEKFKKKEVR